jgi:hypothetical protein
MEKADTIVFISKKPVIIFERITPRIIPIIPPETLMMAVSYTHLTLPTTPYV